MCLFLFCAFVFCFMYSVFFVVFVLFCVLFLLLCCPFHISVQVYRPLPPVGNRIAANDYILYHIISYIIYHIIHIHHLLLTCGKLRFKYYVQKCKERRVSGFSLQLNSLYNKPWNGVELAFLQKAGSLTECKKKKNYRLCTVDVSINRDRLSV